MGPPTEIEDGDRDGLTLAEETEIRELNKRNRLLEPENEVSSSSGLPRARREPKMIHPLVRDLASDGIRDANVPPREP